jgi:hypothetical protein
LKRDNGMYVELFEKSVGFKEVDFLEERYWMTVEMWLAILEMPILDRLDNFLVEIGSYDVNDTSYEAMIRDWVRANAELN